MEPITGTLSVILEPVTIAPAAPPHTYLGVANSMFAGVTVLAAASPPPALPLSFLCAHTLECILKAFLSRSGDDTRLKQPGIRHDLNKLWVLASTEGFQIPNSPPPWIDCLSTLHAFPYYLRYSTGVHGIVSPPSALMVSDLAALLQQVRQQI